MAGLSRRKVIAASAGAVAACGILPIAGGALAAEVLVPQRKLAAGGLFRATFHTPSGNGDGKWPGGGPHALHLVLPHRFEAIGAWATEYDPEQKLAHAGNAFVVTRSVQLYGERQDRCRILFDILQAREANQGQDAPYVDPVHIGVSMIGWAAS